MSIGLRTDNVTSKPVQTLSESPIAGLTEAKGPWRRGGTEVMLKLIFLVGFTDTTLVLKLSFSQSFPQ